MQKINVVTLGCSKNLVDSEFLLKQLQNNGYEVFTDSDNTDAKTVIINTCGFIQDAKEESIETILQFTEAKKKGLIDNIFVMGCLSQRYKDELKSEIPEVDHFFGKFEIKKIIEILKASYKAEFSNQRYLTTPKHYAYLKISEGCDRTCSFCSIPIMTGKHISKPIEALLEEAQNLANQGVKELLLIAQDLSYYGLDIYKKNKLADLITELSKIDKIEWIKLHYAYPVNFPFDVLSVMAQNPKVCKYLDIALQHINNDVLKLMRRNITDRQTRELVSRIRQEVPGIALRTTMLVGHPGESKKAFDELVDFVQEARFERLGVFTYSKEENTYAATNYEDKIKPSIKKSRADKVLEIQNVISKEFSQSNVGKILKVLIDRQEGDYYIGRTEFDSPEVDGEVLISSKSNTLSVGNFYNISIDSAEDYDLFGSLVMC